MIGDNVTRLARESVSGDRIMSIYSDGTFTLKGLFGKESVPEKLIAFDFDADSMRRKSASGRGAAALLTGGASLIASNNRGVFYVTIVGATTGAQTFTTRNPDGHILTGARTLAAVAGQVTRG